MAEDEFFKRIAETEQAEPRPSERPIGTADRRGARRVATEEVEDAQPEEQADVVELARSRRSMRGAISQPAAALRAGLDGALARVRAIKLRPSAIAIACGAVAICVVIGVVVAPRTSAPQPSRETSGESQTRSLAVELAAVRSSEAQARRALEQERVRTRARLARQRRRRDGGADSRVSADPAASAAGPVSVGGSAGAREGFGFEVPGP